MAAAAAANALMNGRCSLCSSRWMALTRKRRIGSHAVGATRRTVVAAGGLGAAGVVLVGGIAAACAATAAQASERKNDAGSYVQSGMAKFLKNELPEALEDFDAALDLRPSARPYLWQRGLCLYYLKQYEEGSRQFRDDVAVNPNDTEEAIWAFLCEAQLSSAADARSRFLTVGTDSRPVLRAAYACFRDGTDPQAILQSVRRGSGSDAFYAWLYVGLWNEAEGNETESRAALENAVQTQYAKTSGDYMAGLARVHRQQRGWDSLTA